MKESLSIQLAALQLHTPPDTNASTTQTPHTKRTKMQIPLDLRRVTRSINESVNLINADMIDDAIKELQSADY